MPNLHKKNPILILIFLLVFSSCDSKHVFEENKSIEKSSWKVTNKPVFSVSIDDIAISYNIFLNIRNRMDYPYSNIYLFLKTTFPDGKISLDTIECLLADYDGRWLGSGVGSVKFNKFLFQKGIYFPQKGKYTLDFEQDIIVNELKGITDIGLRIER